MIEFKHVTKVFPPDNMVLREIDLNIAHGDYVLLTGQAGSGVSVLYQLILRYERVTRGQLIVFGKDVDDLSSREVPYLRRRIGWISQEPQFMQPRSVLENLTNVLHVSGKFGYEADYQAREMLNRLELEMDLNAFPVELSRGQLQKLAIARALINNPAILLADDPFAYLSKTETGNVIKVFKTFNETGMTILLSTRSVEPELLGIKRIVELSNATITDKVLEGVDKNEKK